MTFLQVVGGSSVSVASCEHRYSSSGAAPPPYSRLPPDGHEFPSSYAEGLPDKMSRYARYTRLAMELDSPSSPSAPSTPTPRTRSAPGTPLGPPPPIPRTSPTSAKTTFNGDKSADGGKWSGSEERRSREPTPTRNRWRRQDERSEKSVRDKIAMFSTDGPDQPQTKTRKLDKQEGEESTMKRAFTEDDVRLENLSSGAKPGRESHSRSLSKTSSTFSSMINVSTAEPRENVKLMSTASSEADIRQDLPPTPHREEPRSEDDSATTGLHSRSQSLIDIGRSTLTKRHSVGAYDRPSAYQYGVEKPEDRERRTSLTNLIEQRRKSFGCKLRGLVIPESRGNEGEKGVAIDLPRIASVPPTTASKTMSLPREGQRSPRLYKADSISSIDSCESNTSRHSSLNAPPWKSHGSNTTLPKYSPAFKRKNMAVFKSDNLPPPSGGRSYSTRSSSPTSDLSQASPIPPTHSPPKSLESTPSSEHPYDITDSRYGNDRHSYSKLPLSQKSSYDSRLSRAEDSDNDSAVSSTQSCFSQGMSPPSSPMPEHDEQDVRRNRSYRSRLSPQSSIDDQDPTKRVLKRGSIEAENRRNVLNSARCSSGRNSDEHQTPEIIRKFSSAAPSDRVEESDKFPQRLDSDLRDGPKVTGLRRHPSTSSTSSTASSRRSSQDSRRTSRDSVIHVTKYDEVKVSAEPVYFDQEGEMYKESQVKVAYLNEITDDFEQLNDPTSEEVIAEIPMSASQRAVNTPDSPDTAPSTTSSSSGKRSDRWAKLEMKYGSSNSAPDIESKIQMMRKSSDSTSPDRTKKNSGGFRALAEKWQQRAEEDTSAPQPQSQPQPQPQSQPQLVRRESATRLDTPTRPTRLYDERSPSGDTELGRPSRPSRLYDESSERIASVDSTLDRPTPTRPSRLYDEPKEGNSMPPTRPTCLFTDSVQSSSSNNNDINNPSLEIPRAEVPDRKLSMPEYGSGGVKMRDRREGNNGGAPSRPTSLIEGGDSGVMDSHYLNSGGVPLSPAASTDSRDDLFSTPETSLSRTASKEVLDAFSRPRPAMGVSIPRSGASNIPKMADIMRAFERHDLGKRGTQAVSSSHPRMSSLDSTTSDDGAHYGSVTSLASGQRDQYGSITSLASSTSLISPQELAQLIEEANQSLEESGTPSHEILVVVLHREVVAHGSIGITLAGGADYEAKEITVHKVIPGSLADRDGRIQRGDRVLSINGKNVRGVTHREALAILKSPRPEVVLVLSRSRSVTPQESSGMNDGDGSYTHRPALINHITSPRPPKILESPMDSKSLVSDAAELSVPRGPPLTITLVKDGAGLGFSLEGGKDSPLGDRPLTVKKIFSGGAADKGGVLKVGDELVSVNAVDVTRMARIEAWNFLKKLPDGTVSLILRQKLDDAAAKSEE
ncbi:hypothetical protein Pmani_001941 [Petrolisthes manimaculis]|uniref:PDZ domain-containing protein n=1 Tax=Petrolisthes manimaculis TaxID=1843537 RepID=A0AAE1QJE5_9EUCA|nr:hypothetical protein Pmani_001941 [Petrolisthes manimaculis]